MRCLIFRHGAESLRFAIPAAEVTLGSSPRCDLVAAFDGVSRKHARLVPSGSGVRVVDAGSKNGLILEGRRVGEVLLEEGVVVGLGRGTLTLGNAATSELELALRPARQEDSSSGDTGSEADAEPSGATAALRLVLDAGRSRAGGLDPSLRRRALHALGADSLFDVAAGSPLTIRWCEGRLPDPDALAALEKECERFGNAVAVRRGLPEGGIILLTRSGNGFWAALLPPTSPATDGWQEELLAFLGARSAGSELPPASARREEGDLVFPDAMIVGPSPAFSGLLTQLRATVRSSLDVLLQGETGTGKEIFAKLIHASGPSARGSFVALNCAAIPTELLNIITVSILIF